VNDSFASIASEESAVRASEREHVSPHWTVIRGRGKRGSTKKGARGTTRLLFVTKC